MGLKINLDNRTEFVPNLIATSKVQLDCQDPVATSDRIQPALHKPFNARGHIKHGLRQRGSIHTDREDLATGCCVRFRLPHQSADIVTARHGSRIRSLSAPGSVFVQRLSSISHKRETSSRPKHDHHGLTVDMSGELPHLLLIAHGNNRVPAIASDHISLRRSHSS